MSEPLQALVEKWRTTEPSYRDTPEDVLRECAQELSDTLAGWPETPHGWQPTEEQRQAIDAGATACCEMAGTLERQARQTGDAITEKAGLYWRYRARELEKLAKPPVIPVSEAP